VQITSAIAGTGQVAALVEGTFDVPDWVPGAYFNRGADGLPEPVGTRSIPFILALPAVASSEGRAPLVMYQHGSPGSAQAEVPNAARNFLAGAGFAVGGFTDPPNRIAPTVEELQFAILANVLINGESPDYYVQTYGEQIAFLRALQSLDTLDLLPLGAPDGVPDLDPDAIVYEGISYGSNHGQAFLAYAPDIRAAGMVVGAVRFIELLEHQDRTLPLGGDPLIKVILPSFLTGVRAPDFWMGLSLFAMTYDRQDPHNHARFIYRDPVEIDGTTRKASLLVVEGIDDSFTSNNSTRSLARQLGGIPQLSPTVVDVPDLPEQAGPIQGNVDSQTTAAMVQFAPAGSGLTPTPGCEFQFEGHYCAQSAPSARAQRVRFYQSALAGVPVID
jgi:pimeloyl-ACP methyl ester carboxylesterase